MVWKRIAMYLQGVESVFDLVWTVGYRAVTYRDVFHQNEVEQSAYNFEHADIDFRSPCSTSAKRILHA